MRFVPNLQNTFLVPCSGRPVNFGIFHVQTWRPQGIVQFSSMPFYATTIPSACEMQETRKQFNCDNFSCSGPISLIFTQVIQTSASPKMTKCCDLMWNRLKIKSRSIELKIAEHVSGTISSVFCKFH